MSVNMNGYLFVHTADAAERSERNGDVVANASHVDHTDTVSTPLHEFPTESTNHSAKLPQSSGAVEAQIWSSFGLISLSVARYAFEPPQELLS